MFFESELVTNKFQEVLLSAKYFSYNRMGRKNTCLGVLFRNFHNGGWLVEAVGESGWQKGTDCSWGLVGVRQS